MSRITKTTTASLGTAGAGEVDGERHLRDVSLNSYQRVPSPSLLTVRHLFLAVVIVLHHLDPHPYPPDPIMVLDLDLFRVDKGGDPERVKQTLSNRFKDVKVVDQVVDLDSRWRKCRHDLDQLNKAKNSISKSYGIKVKESKGKGALAQESKEPESTGDEPTDLNSLLQAVAGLSVNDSITLDRLKQMRTLTEEETMKLTQEMSRCEQDRNEILREIGNLLHPDVPISDDEDNNAIIKVSGNIELGKESDHPFLSHVDLISMINGINTEKGSVIAGSRGYFILGPAVWLQQALISYALQFAADKGYVPIYTPFWMTKSLMGQVAQLSQFDEELYKLGESSKVTANEQSEAKYLIATSEQPLAALHAGEWLDPKELPIKYAGISTCFRQEAGSHGRDTRGIFRVHQFEKVEQFVITAPKDSWIAFHQMIQTSEAFYESLGIPFRVVSIVSGALNNAAAMKYDLEGWFPGSKAYRELVSVSNCTDYQSRRLQIRYGQTKKMTGQVEFVHMLNGTLTAITRTICAVLEVHQTEKGINVPAALQRFMPHAYRSFIPFVAKDAPVALEKDGKDAAKTSTAGSKTET